MNFLQFDLKKIIVFVAIILVGTTGIQKALDTETKVKSNPTYNKTVKVNGPDIFYREAGPKNAPTILSLHGFPTSSHMLSNLIPALSDRFESWTNQQSRLVLAKANPKGGSNKGRKKPTADAGGPYMDNVNEPIAFDGSDSSDPNGDILTYHWDFGDGATALGPNPTHSYSQAGEYIATLTVDDGKFHNQNETSVTVNANGEEPPPEGDPSFGCLDNPGPLEVITGFYNTEKFEPETAPQKKFDARASSFEIPETISHSMIVLRSSDDDHSMCWAGGYVTASLSWHDLDISWYESKHGYDNTETDRGEMENTAGGEAFHDSMTWTGVHIYNVHDGIRTSNSFNNWRIQHFWLDYIRDDCIENDHIYSGEIYDSLFDGCYSGFSARPSSSGFGNGEGTIIKMDKVLMRMEPMPHPHSSATTFTIPGYGSTPFGSGNTFKLESGNEPTFEITNSVFLHEYDSNKLLFPPKDKVSVCDNNVIIWLGDPAAAPNYLLSEFAGCFTLITDEAQGKAFWKSKVEDWHQRHPEVGANHKPSNPGEYIWPRYPG